MKKLTLILGVSLLVSILCSGCGGGGGSDDGPGALEGTWYGWIEDDEGAVEEFSLQIDADGNISDVAIGGVGTGDTGHINEGYDENVFHLLYDGPFLGHGIMIVDDQVSHSVYGDYGSKESFFYLGVLQKGTASSPIYSSSDIVGNYPVGGAYEGDSGLWEGDEVTMTVDAGLLFSGTAPGESFSGSFYDYDQNYGRYAGEMTRSTDPLVALDITAFVSPDREAVAAFATSIANPAYLEDFILIGLTKP